MKTNPTWSLAVYMLHLHTIHAWSWFLWLLLVQVPVKIQPSGAVQNLTNHRATLGVTHLPVCHDVTWISNASNCHSCMFPHVFLFICTGLNWKQAYYKHILTGDNSSLASGVFSHPTYKNMQDADVGTTLTFPKLLILYTQIYQILPENTCQYTSY